MQIQPITEEAHNTAMLTIIAERQELLYYRTKLTELEKALLNEKAEHQQTKGNYQMAQGELAEAEQEVEELEVQLAEAKGRITIHKLNDQDE